MCGEKRQELGIPERFLSWVSALGICPPLTRGQVGGHGRPSREANDPLGVGSAHTAPAVGAGVAL